MAAATAFHAPATPTIVSSFQPDPTHAYEVRGLAYDGMPEPVTPSVATATPIVTEVATPPVSPPPTPEPVVVAATAPVDIPALICSYDWPCEDALRIATCESGLQPWAENGRFKGIFQLDTYNGGWFSHFGYDVVQWADPATNVQVAYLLYASSGWGPWQCK